MITNARECRITRAAAKRFEGALAALAALFRAKGREVTTISATKLEWG